MSLKSQASQGWDRLASAAVAARDDLRSLASDLDVAMANGRIPPALIVRCHRVALRHTDGLRVALKHPEAESPVRRLNLDLPCWSTIEGDR